MNATPPPVSPAMKAESHIIIVDGDVNERRRQVVHRHYSKPELLAKRLIQDARCLAPPKSNLLEPYQQDSCDSIIEIFHLNHWTGELTDVAWFA